MKNNWKDDFESKCESGHFKIGEIDKSLLVKFIESLLAEQKKELLESILDKAPEYFPEELNPELQHEVLAEIIGTKLENFNMGYNQCNLQWKEIIESLKHHG